MRKIGIEIESVDGNRTLFMCGTETPLATSECLIK